MKRHQYNFRLAVLAVLFGATACGAAIGIYFMAHDWRYSAVSLAGSCALCLLAFALHRLDDMYISGIVADLSGLMDVLMGLEDKEIFPGEEESLVSKLQNKVIKLAHILKRKNEMEAQEKENIKGLVSDISHQLKTPISNLKIYSSILQEGALTEEKRLEYTKVICVSVERLDFLAENLIKISRLESGIIHLHMQEQSLNETVLQAIKDIYPKARANQIEVEYFAEEEVSLCHDRNWTAEAVFNLLDNGVKYAEAGGRIVLKIRRMGMFVEVSVEDENGAIPKQERPKVFARFYRGKNSRGREGIGVGLYLSREIAIRQGGYMNLRTTEKGNVFCIFMR